MWQVGYSKRFLKELADLPHTIRTRVETIVFEELKTENPFALGYIEKMTGYPE
jgi:mRNA-degrading endonuclease RelE of RelBE toxin-antitoxin system